MRKKHKIKVPKTPRASYSPSSNVKCPACQTVYTNLQFLKKHIVTVHRNEMDEKLDEIMAHDYDVTEQPDKIVGDKEEPQGSTHLNFSSLLPCQGKISFI